MSLPPITLTGARVALVPLAWEHLAAALAVAVPSDIFHWWPRDIRTPADLRASFEEAFAARDGGTALPFSTFDRASDQLVGGTRYMAVDLRNRRLEIGGTWVARPWQRTYVNTEAKLLMLEHAFETLGCLRVEFKTDALNTASRAALDRLGAQQEGVFRKHMVTSAARVRDTVYFSIVDDEWPDVKARLLAKLAR